MALNNSHNLSQVLCDDLKFCLEYSNRYHLDTLTSFLAVIDILLLLATLFNNGTFVAAILFNRRIYNSSNFLLLNLVIVNSIFGSLGFGSCSLFRFHNFSCNRQLCVIQDIFVYFAGTGLCMSLTSFTVISIERYVCIFYALTSREIITTRRILIAIALIWFGLLSSLTTCYFIGFTSAFYMIYTIGVILNTVILLTTNGRIFKEIRRHESRIAQATPQGQGTTGDLRRIHEKRRAKTIIIMVAIVFLCYVPTLILVALSFISSIDQVQLQLGWIACRSIPLTHTTFGVLVYSLRTNEIKQSYINLANKLRCTT